MTLRLALLAAAVLATAAPRPFDAVQLESFQTPSGNIACMADDMDEDGRWELRCDVGEREWEGGPPGPDCEGDWGDSVGLRPTGRPFWVCHGDTILRSGPVLGYGSTWRKGPFTCVVARTGVTCRNRSQNGFTLSRASYRLF
jgi:hypothetical protein